MTSSGQDDKEKEEREGEEKGRNKVVREVPPGGRIKGRLWIAR